jgi:hypothetical protein
MESLEYAAMIKRGEARADDRATGPAHFSVAHLDYWDWYFKITEQRITAKKAIRDELDSGGSWGAAVEIISKVGLMRAGDFLSQGDAADAKKVRAALDSVATSLTKGSLRDPAARANGVLVRRELDRAFKLKSDVVAELTKVFGEDGARSFEDGTAHSTGRVTGPADLQIVLPRPSGAIDLHTLREAIGVRAAPGDDPDDREGELAWRVVPFSPGSPSENRAYFLRIQKALHAGVPLPISWYVASNGDPDDTGE